MSEEYKFVAGGAAMPSEAEVWMRMAQTALAQVPTLPMTNQMEWVTDTASVIARAYAERFLGEKTVVTVHRDYTPEQIAEMILRDEAGQREFERDVTAADAGKEGQ